MEARPSETALQGQGSTALAAAIRSGAPTEVVEALFQANNHQMAITHRHRGSVLHEALNHRVNDDVLQFLLETMIDYQQNVMANTSRAPDPTISSDTNSLHPSRTLGFDQFKQVCVQDHRFLSCPNLLGVVDDMGRTALHLLVERAKRYLGNVKRSRSTWCFFQKLLTAYPEAARMKDSDGNTPLVLILFTPRGIRCSQTESHISRMVELMLSVCPETALITRRRPRPWRFQPLPTAVSNNQNSSNMPQSALENSPTPLYFALLFGRTLETINLLLQANKSHGQSGCSVPVTQYQEVCLHVAVTTGVPLSILYHVLHDNPKAVLSPDVYDLTPLDWLWIRYVLDCHSNPLENAPSRIISRRRFLTNQFYTWHDQAAKNVNIVDHVVSANPVAIRNFQLELLQRMKLLLPVAASLQAGDSEETANMPWSLLHAVCYVPCPIGLVRASLAFDSDSLVSVKTRDSRMGRYPLHYAVSRRGYEGELPIGVSQTLHKFSEPAPVHDILPLYPEACQQVDINGQLPLHIAIDTAKDDRCYWQGVDEGCGEVWEECDVLRLLLEYNATALECLDGKTQLYPWQQAAVGPGSSLNTVYTLLRAHPVVIKHNSP